MPIFSLMSGPKVGSYDQIGGKKVESFCDTPFHAKAMELMASEHDARAELKELPLWSTDESESDKKKRKAVQSKIRKYCAEWLRLEASVLRWRAKNLRSEDKLQKGLYGDHENIKEIENDIHRFMGCPKYSNLLSLLSKYHGLCAKMTRHDRKFPMDGEDKKWAKLSKEKAGVVADIYQCKADCLAWKAKKEKSLCKVSKSEQVIEDVDNAMNLLKANGNSVSRSPVFRGSLQLEVEGYRSRYRLAPTPFQDPSHPFTMLDETIQMVKSLPLDLAIDELKTELKGK